MSSTTSEKGLRAARARQKKDMEIDREVIVALMSTVAGRRWVWLQLEFAQLTNGNAELDPYYMAFEKGRRNTGLKLLASVTGHAPSMYVRMMEEATSIKLTFEEENNDDRTDAD